MEIPTEAYEKNNQRPTIDGMGCLEKYNLLISVKGGAELQIK